MLLSIFNGSRESFSDDPYSGSMEWFVINIFIAAATTFGNILTILAILLSKKLSATIANQFIFSLAVSDLLVGLSLPYHMCFYLLEDFGEEKLSCLLRFASIAFACASSIWNLLLIATDRYVGIVYPLHYNRFMTRRVSILMIAAAWTTSFSMASVPLAWNEWHEGIHCELVEVIPNAYMNFVVLPMFVLVWLFMLLMYLRICREANGHVKRIRNASSIPNLTNIKDSRSFQVMLTIFGCFTICWFPYLVITLYQRTTRDRHSALLYEIAFNLAASNSAMNPIIYAWKNSNFRKAFLCLLKCQSPDATANGQYVTNHVPSKKSSISINGVCNVTCIQEGISPSGNDILEMRHVKLTDTGESGTLTEISNATCSSRIL